MLLNYTWANDGLTPNFRKLFDLIYEIAVDCKKEQVARMALHDLCQARLPSVDTFRNFLLDPANEAELLTTLRAGRTDPNSSRS